MDPKWWLKHLWLSFCLICFGVLIWKATPVHADELWVNIGGPSYHTDRSKLHNERNYGLGLHYKYSDNWSVVGGFYKNSLANTTYYVAAPYMPLRYERLSAGVSPGLLAGGYSVRWAPYILPTARLELTKDLALNLIYVPPVAEVMEEVYWLNFEVRLK